MPLTPGSRLGHYEIIALLGKGGMGEVYRARDTVLRRDVAIKVLASFIAGDPNRLRRFQLEARAAAALNHPSILAVFQLGTHGGTPYLVCELLEGSTLREPLRTGPMPLRRVVDYGAQIARGLTAAHRAGIVHRDLKPENLFVTTDGRVKILDFGLAKLTQPSWPVDESTRTVTAATEAGAVMGTVGYMSPEQVSGRTADHRADIFALGTVLYEMLTGMRSFQKPTAVETMHAILKEDPRDISQLAPAVPPSLQRVVQRCLEKNPEQRFQSASDLAFALEALSDSGGASVPALARIDQAGFAREMPTHDTVPAPERTPFVGRTTETAELTRALDRLLTGRGGVVLIGGEPGVGKTRLARELLRAAQARGCLGLTGHCSESEGAPPFAPFIESIEQAVRLMPQAVRAAMGEQAAELSTVVPSLRRTYHDVPPTPEVPPEQQRRLVFGAFLDSLGRATAQTPMVLMLDDLHWADDASLQLLLHLAPHLEALGILVVGTYRDVELEITRPLAKTLETLLRQRLVTRLSLRRLNESGVEQLLAATSGSTPPLGLSHVIFRETDGNPFFVEEVYRHLLDDGKLFDAQGQWRADLRLDTLAVPEGVRLVIGRRLERLGDAARKVLTAAAVIGRRFSADLLPAMVDLDDDTVFDAIEAAERAQLVALEPHDREARYAFVHELIRTTLVSGLVMPRRQRLHLKVADVIERQRAATLESHAAVMAHHLFQAGSAADAIRTATYLVLAGRQALGAGAFEEAVEAAERVLSLELGDETAERAGAYELRGTALLGLERLDEATASLDRAFTQYAARRDDAAIVRVTRARSRPPWWRWRPVAVKDVVAQGLQTLSDRSPRERANLQAWLAISLAGLSRFDEAADQIASAVETAERLADVELLGRVLAAQSNCFFRGGEFLAAAAAGRRALSLLPAAAVWDRADALISLSNATLVTGAWAENDALRPEFDATARRAGNSAALLICEYHEHRLRWMRSGHTRAWLAQATHWLRDLPYFAFLSETYVAMGELYLGQEDAALDRLSHLCAIRPAVADFFQGMREGNLFLAYVLARQADRARAVYSSVEGLLPVPGRRSPLGSWMALEGAVYGLACLGETSTCGALYQTACEAVANGSVCNGLSIGASTAQLVAGLAAQAAGLPDRAPEHFEIAQRLADELPQRLLQPTVGYWYGRFLFAQPEVAERLRGRAMIHAALEDFRSLEMVPHATLAEQWLRTTPETP